MTISLSQFNPLDPNVIESPWEFFSALRREAPLYELPNKAYYLISRHEDVMKAVMDTETFSSNLVAVLMQDHSDTGPTFLNMSGASDALAIADPPAHTRQRRVSNRTITLRKVADMEDDIRVLVNALLDTMLARGECDWVKEFAIPLPMTMIIRLLGLPISDMAQLKEWSDHGIALLNGVNTSSELTEHALEAGKMIEYMAAQVASITQEPRPGIINDLIRASENDSESLSRQEIISTVVQLITAGNETTASLLGSAMMLMLQTPGLQAQLRAHPEKIEPFIEEALRIESPFHGHFRLVKKDTQIAGQPLTAGSRVMLLWSSANRDEQAFPCAGTLDLSREKPRAHLSFGYGIHHCIGAALARAEARIAIETFLARTQDIQLASNNDFQHVPSLMIRSLKKLTLRFQEG